MSCLIFFSRAATTWSTYSTLTQSSPGTFSSTNGSTGCGGCAPGSISGAGASLCSVCGAGSYEANRTACVRCAAGTYSSANGSTGCAGCASGSYSSAGGFTYCTVCTACDANAALVAQCNATANNSRCVCNAGYIGDGFKCTQCAAGTYEANRSSCVRCASGAYSESNGSTQCTLCGAGTYSNASGSTGCRACAFGTWNEPGASACMWCARCDANADTTGPCVRGAFQCRCKAGFWGSGLACAACPACLAPNYTAVGVCGGTFTNMSCECAAGYWGAQCDACRECGPNSAVASECNRFNNTECTCNAGYEGEPCALALTTILMLAGIGAGGVAVLGAAIYVVILIA